jgi:hypothetical protein
MVISVKYELSYRMVPGSLRSADLVHSIYHVQQAVGEQTKIKIE